MNLNRFWGLGKKVRYEGGNSRPRYISTVTRNGKGKDILTLGERTGTGIRDSAFTRPGSSEFIMMIPTYFLVCLEWGWDIGIYLLYSRLLAERMAWNSGGVGLLPQRVHSSSNYSTVAS
jgi:hypothetical protein